MPDHIIKLVIANLRHFVVLFLIDADLYPRRYAYQSFIPLGNNSELFMIVIITYDFISDPS